MGHSRLQPGTNEPMNTTEAIRCALAIHDAGHSWEVDPEDVAKLLAAYDALTVPRCDAQGARPGRETLVHTICPHIKQWCDDVDVPDTTCKRCPATVHTSQGEGVQMCRLNAERAADAVLSLASVQAAPARDDLAEWKQAASVEAGLRREFLARAERLRLELEKIAWMDEFLDAHGAKVMMQIARDAVNEDERCSTGSEPSKQDFGPWTSPGREGGHFKPDEKMK